MRIKTSVLCLSLFFLSFFSCQVSCVPEAIHEDASKQKYDLALKSLQEKVSRIYELRPRIRVMNGKKANVKAYREKFKSLAEKLRKQGLFVFGDPNKLSLQGQKLIELLDALNKEKRQRTTKYLYVRTSILRWLVVIGVIVGVSSILFYLSSLDSPEKINEASLREIDRLREENRGLNEIIEMYENEIPDECNF